MANLHIVYGAPLSGKTSYVNSVLGYNDIVYDYDAIMRAMTNKAYQETIRGAVPYVLGVRDMMVDKLHDDVYIDNAYIIATFIGKQLDTDIKELQPNYIKMQTTVDECLDRLDDSNRNDKKQVKQTILEWFDKYGGQGEHVPHSKRRKFYRSKDWKELREFVLARDNYECQWCKARGKVTTRDDAILEIDHIIEIDKDFSLSLEPENCRTLCRGCHNYRHNRFAKQVKQVKPAEIKKWDSDEMW